MSVCPASGNIGFPVMPAGQIDLATTRDRQEFSMKLAASPTATGRTIDGPTGFINDNGIGGTTFYFGNTPYSLAAIQVTRPHNRNYITTLAAVATGAVMADVVFYFEMLAGNYVGNKALVYIVPCVSAASATSSAGASVSTEIDAYLADAQSRSAETPRVKSVEPFFTVKGTRVLYSTCLNMVAAGGTTAVPTMTIQVIVSPPAFLSAATAGPLGEAVRAGYMWPSNIPRVGGEIPKLEAGQTSLASNNRSLNEMKYSLTESPVERFMGGGRLEYVRSPEDLRTTQQYKCMPLDELKDVSGSMVLLDPASGTRTLADELDDRSASVTADLGGAVPAPGVSKSAKTSVVTIIAIVLGVLLGVGVIGGFLWWWLRGRSSGGGGGGGGTVVSVVDSPSGPANTNYDGGLGNGTKAGTATGALAGLAAGISSLQQARRDNIATRKAALEAKRPGAAAPAVPAAAPAAAPAPAPTVNPAAGTGLPLPSNEEIAAAATGVPRANQQMPANELTGAFRAIVVPQGQPQAQPQAQAQETRQPEAVALTP